MELFITSIEKELDIKAVFKEKKRQVFRQFSDFHIVLSGLALIAKKLEPKLGVPKFDSRSKETKPAGIAPLYSNIYEGNDDYDIYESKKEVRMIYDDMYSIAEQTGANPLARAIDDMVMLNENFVSKVLKHIKTNFDVKASNFLLKEKFFPVFQIDRLIQLHLKLQYKFEKIQYSYIEIGSTFDELKDEFLVYCEILPKIGLALEFLADQMTENEEVLESVHRLQREAAKCQMVKDDPKLVCCIKQLVMMIPQHFMRYHMLIDEVARKAQNAAKPEIETEARKAHRIMLNLTQHIDRVSKDFNYIEAMSQLKQEIRNVPHENLHKFGLLQRELVDVKMSVSNEDARSFQPFYLLIFSEHIVALEVRTRLDCTGKVDFFGVAIREKSEEKVYSRSFRMKDIDNIMVKEASSKTFHLWAKSYTQLNVDMQKSFILRFDSQGKANEIAATLKQHVGECKTKLEISKEHEGHTCSKIRGRGDLTGCKQRCSSPECNQLLLGILYSGVECRTCRKVFHTNCAAGRPECGQKVESAPQSCLDEELMEKPNDLQLEDFDIGEVSRVEAVAKMKGHPAGTFLLRFSNKHKHHMLEVKTSDQDPTKRVLLFHIKSVEVHGEVLYYIEKGTCGSSILELVRLHRASHQLFIPYHLSRNSRANSGITDGDHKDYFFGDINSTVATEMLITQEPGTFLLRKNGETYKLSWRAPCEKMMHATVKEEDGCYYLTSKNTFFSIHELITHYQRVDPGHQLAIGSPLTRTSANKSGFQDQEDVFAMEPEDNEEEALERMGYYRGVMSKTEAEQELRREEDGAFLLRRTEWNDLIISHISRQAVVHMPVSGSDTGGYWVEDLHVERQPTISRLVDALVAKGLLCPVSKRRSLKADYSRFSGSAAASLVTTDRIQIRSPSRNQNQQMSRSLTPSTLQEHYGPNMSRSLTTSRLQEHFGSTMSASRSSYDSNRLEVRKPQRSASTHSFEALDKKSESQEVEAHGKKSKNCKWKAEDVLFNMPNGSWTFRCTCNVNEESISVVKGGKVVHMKVYHSERGVALRAADRPVPMADLIRRLKSQGVIGQQVDE